MSNQSVSYLKYNKRVYDLQFSTLDILVDNSVFCMENTYPDQSIVPVDPTESAPDCVGIFEIGF